MRYILFLSLLCPPSFLDAQAPCFSNIFSDGSTIFEEQLKSGETPASLEKTDTFDVVFHILHTGEAVGQGGNISDDQIESAVLSLNRDFNAWPIHDSISIHPNGVDSKLYFRLACRDPQGMPSSGIVRVNGTVVPGYAQDGFVFIAGNTGNNNALVALSRWPATRYINIWVTHRILTPFTGVTLGGGFGPGSVLFNAGGGGLYLNYRAVGCDPDGSKGYTLTNRYGKVISHEMGHYFGLLHTFEGEKCAEINCNVEGDRVCDTEAHNNARSNDASCNETVECGSREPVENLMNYSGPTCGNIFTAGQKNRMKTFIQQFLATVYNQSVCQLSSSNDDTFPANAISLFPNPCAGMLTIQLPVPGQVKLFDSMGQFLHNEFLTDGTHTLSVIDFPKGMLYFTFQTKDSLITQRFIHE